MALEFGVHSYCVGVVGGDGDSQWKNHKLRSFGRARNEVTCTGRVSWTELQSGSARPTVHCWVSTVPGCRLGSTTHWSSSTCWHSTPGTSTSTSLHSCPGLGTISTTSSLRGSTTGRLVHVSCPTSYTQTASLPIYNSHN